MTISQLRQEALELRDLAVQVHEYGMNNSLGETWQRVVKLFRQVRYVLANRAGPFTLDGATPSWNEVAKRAEDVMHACDTIEPQPSSDIPGDYGA